MPVGKEECICICSFVCCYFNAFQPYVGSKGCIFTTRQEAKVGRLVFENKFELASATRVVCRARSTIAPFSGFTEIVGSSAILYFRKTNIVRGRSKTIIGNRSSRVAYFASIAIVGCIARQSEVSSSTAMM